VLCRGAECKGKISLISACHKIEAQNEVRIKYAKNKVGINTIFKRNLSFKRGNFIFVIIKSDKKGCSCYI